MIVRAFLIAGLLAATRATPAPPPSTPAPPTSPADPFFLPPEARAFALRATFGGMTVQTKLRGLVRAIFMDKADGGMGLVYDNERTRNVAEVWQEGKANCLSLTAFYVECCRSVGIQEEFAEALNTNHWRRVGGMVRYERHVVGLTYMPPFGDIIADFVPELRKRFGMYVVAVLPERRFRSLYYSNLAVEALTDDNLDEAKTQIQLALGVDPTCSVGWNVLGVVSAVAGERVKAEEAYRHALALDPKDGAPIGNMEALMGEEGRTEEALKFRQLGELVRKKDPYFHAYLAEEALASGDLDAAAANIKTALKLIPEEPDFHLFQARLKLAEGDLDAATKELQVARRWSNPSERERFDSKLASIRNMRKTDGQP